MSFKPYAWDDGISIKLILPLEPPGVSWPSGAPVFIQTFSFPLRCKPAVLALLEEIRKLKGTSLARTLVKERQREIMWPN